jgi:hypothetical protein
MKVKEGDVEKLVMLQGLVDRREFERVASELRH